MIFNDEQLLQRVTSNFLKRATSTTSNKQILQCVTSDFATSNEQRLNLQRVTSEFHNK